ncbi:hypothetical protein ANCDUO_05906 [Ancylostoma duodenale]|uniref:Uncharacterized protein n=1 Tax=Ancylostoma duodenale TaxID=51022 RepID=A0A0C2H2Y0_9BILA|nr:hypothetical protein ANCDUO_05906 [Ancylostoma duodenale]
MQGTPELQPGPFTLFQSETAAARRGDEQDKDMESLRYEISWKDERIEYLQKTLAEMEEALPSSSADH